MSSVYGGAHISDSVCDNQEHDLEGQQRREELVR